MTNEIAFVCRYDAPRRESQHRALLRVGRNGPTDTTHALAAHCLILRPQTFKQDVSGAVWSSKLLFEDPDVIYKAHLAFLESGADLILTGTLVLQSSLALSTSVRFS